MTPTQMRELHFVAAILIFLLFGSAVVHSCSRQEKKSAAEAYCHPFVVFGYDKNDQPVCAGRLPREDYPDE